MRGPARDVEREINAFLSAEDATILQIAQSETCDEISVTLLFEVRGPERARNSTILS